MKPASSALIALLDSAKFIMAELYTITLTSGTVYRYTSADRDLIYNGNTFSSLPVERGRVRLTIGVQVDTVDVTLYTGVNDLIEGAPFAQFAHQGGFDNARVLIERAFMAEWGDTSPGVLHIFSGRVAGVEPSRTTLVLHINSDLDLLNVKLPRNLYQPGCLNTLFDAGCGLNKASFATAWTVASASGLTVNGNTAGIPAPRLAADYYTLGTIHFLTGHNASQVRTVKSYNNGAFGLISALPKPVEAGDTFNAYPGCDRTWATCQAKFSHTRFRGFPRVPKAEQGL